MKKDKILAVSYNGFSHTNASGKTLYALLCSYDGDELIQFYRGNEELDFSFAHSYFHVTDREMLNSFFFKKPVGEYEFEGEEKSGTKVAEISTNAALSGGLRRHNYNFWLRYLREILWSVAPWGKNRFLKWVDKNEPKAIFYMVAESIFNDKIVLKIAKNKNIPIVLYNCEGYRLVDLRERKGIERLFYKNLKKTYKKLQSSAEAVIYNCSYLLKRYETEYGESKQTFIAYNGAEFDTTPYKGDNKELSIAYFGNLGVGRVPSLLQVADYLKANHPQLKIDVYGRPSKEDEVKLSAHPSIKLHGFVGQDVLKEVREKADILLHVESFDSVIIPKLKNAYSTKIAQCLCSGRALLTYAPLDMASTEYLIGEECACVATSKTEMEEKLEQLITSGDTRMHYAKAALSSAKENHDLKKTAREIKKLMGEIYEN